MQGARRGGVRCSAAVLGSGLRWRARCGRRGLGTEFKGRAEDHGALAKEGDRRGSRRSLGAVETDRATVSRDPGFG